LNVWCFYFPQFHHIDILHIHVEMNCRDVRSQASLVHDKWGCCLSHWKQQRPKVLKNYRVSLPQTASYDNKTATQSTSPVTEKGDVTNSAETVHGDSTNATDTCKAAIPMSERGSGTQEETTNVETSGVTAKRSQVPICLYRTYPTNGC